MDFTEDLKQEEAQRLANKNQNFLENFVQLPQKEGSATIRLLPPSHGMKYPFQTTRLHRLDNKSFHCPKEYVNGKLVGSCPACDKYNELWNIIKKKTGKQQPTPEERKKFAPHEDDLQARIKPIPRFYYNAVVRDDPTQVGVKIFSTGKTLHDEKIMKAFCGDPEIPSKKKLGDITDVSGKTGRDLLIVKKLKGQYPNYNDSEFLDPSPLGSEEEIKELLSKCNNLADLRVVKSVEEIKSALDAELGLSPSTQSETNDNPVTKVSKTEKVEVKNEVKTESSEEDSMVDEEFLAELNNI